MELITTTRKQVGGVTEETTVKVVTNNKVSTNDIKNLLHILQSKEWGLNDMENEALIGSVNKDTW